MREKYIKKLIVGCLLAAMALSTFGTAMTAWAEEPEQATVRASGDRNFYYLSEIPYLEEQSYVGYETILLDNSNSGPGIQLNVGGKTVSFEAGVCAHAKSCVVYDISAYSEVQSRFIAYVGVDARVKNNGNGVKFTISVSDDGEHWQDLEQTGPLKGNSDAVFVDVMVTGKKFLKLYADDLGQKGHDHAVYADARLMKPDYNPNVENNVPFHTVEEYDAILSGMSVEENLSRNIHTIYEREFVNRIGYGALKRLYNHADYREAIEFLRNDEQALAYFIEGGPLSKMGGTSPYKGMVAFCQIYNKHKDLLKDPSEDNFYLRLAVSIASAFNYPSNVCFWMEPNKGSDPVKRFETYITLSEPGGIMDDAGQGEAHNKWSGSQFRALKVPMMRWVVDARMNDDEFFWLANYAFQARADQKNFLDAYTYIEYKNTFQYHDPRYYAESNRKMWNDKYDFEDYFDDYGKDIRRLWIVFEEGAVCGGLAKTYANLAEVFGRPSTVVGQPGHAATLTWQYAPAQNRYIWTLQNDVSGWTKFNSERGDYMLGWGTSEYAMAQRFRGVYAVMAYDAVEDFDNYVKANQCVLLANSYQDQKTKEQLYRKAIEFESFNLDAWDGLTTVKLADTALTSKDYLNYGQEIMDALTYYPRPMDDLLNPVKAKVTDVHDLAEFELLRLEALKTAQNATLNESRQPDIWKLLANELLNINTSYLASFSFDGEKAGKIVLNEMYDESSVRVKYSIDGGKEWIVTPEHEIQLTDEQLAQLTAENDIQVGLVGVKNSYTIDLVSPKRPKDNGVRLNDYENLFVGATKNLEFSQDGGATWHEYIPGLDAELRFSGDQEVALRYANHGCTLKSEIDTYTFSANADTPEKTYLPLKHVKMVSCSSQQNNGDQAGRNLIDGNMDTRWHSAYHLIDKMEYIVEFDEPRFLSALEYFPHSPNGRWRDVKIYISLDKKNWEEVGSASLKNTEDMKTIILNSEHQAKYLMVQGLNSWGNSAAEENRYFSGRMLNFYEDRSKDNLPLAEVSYSNTNHTNQDVVASIELPDGYEMLEGERTYTFTENGIHPFRYKDQYDNHYEVLAQVDWIRKAELTGTITYSETKHTYNHVTATVDGFEFDDVYVSNNDQMPVYTFTKNGTFTFELADSYGNTGKVTATVDYIDSLAPAVHVEYSETQWTGEAVKAVLKADRDGESFTVVNNGGKNEFVFEKNGSFAFEVRDEAGHTGKVIATVGWMDASKDQVQTVYSTQEETYGPVQVRVTIDPSAHQIVNNGGADSYTFRENGTFVFKIRLLSSGKVVDYPVTVSNIATVVIPEPEPELPPEAEPETPVQPQEPWEPEPEGPADSEPQLPQKPESNAPAAPAPNVEPKPVQAEKADGSAPAAQRETESETLSGNAQTAVEQNAEQSAEQSKEPVEKAEETEHQKVPETKNANRSAPVIVGVTMLLCVIAVACGVGVWLHSKKK